MAKLPIVAIIGRANAGKSSLFNRLVKGQQAIVAREAGTTRDNVVGKVQYLRRNVGKQQNQEPRVMSQKVDDISEEASLTLTVHDKRVATGGAAPTFEAIKDSSKEGADRLTGPADSDLRSEATGREYDGSGKGQNNHSNTGEFMLIDTAGLKTAEDDFEAGIQDQIEDAAGVADVILVVVDSTNYPGDDERLVAKKALKSKKPVILITNKADLKEALHDDEFKRLGVKDIIRTSAEHNSGISELLDRIATLIPEAHTTEPDDVVRIALIGRPNTGKSSLFNTLGGKQQALVANVAGTTRDLNRVSVNYKSQAIELIDTAGVRRQGKQERGIEKFSVLRTMQAIQESDICLLLMDVNELNAQLDQRLAGIIAEAGKGLVLVVSKWDAAQDRDAFTRDALAPKIQHNFDFVPWAPLIFTSAVTGQNVTKLFDIALQIMERRQQKTSTRALNDMLQSAVAAHPVAGLKNTHPRLRYIVQTDHNPPWFVVYGSNLKFLHWSYKRYLEHSLRDLYDYTGTPIKFSFRDEKQIKANKQRIAEGKEPVTKAYKQRKEAEKRATHTNSAY